MLNEITKTAEISWIINNANIEQPYADEGEDYTEYTFTGNLPRSMAQKIQTLLKKYHTKNGYCVTETWQENGRTFNKTLTLHFGQKMSSQYKITFCYSTESWAE